MERIHSLKPVVLRVDGEFSLDFLSSRHRPSQRIVADIQYPSCRVARSAPPPQVSSSSPAALACVDCTLPHQTPRVGIYLFSLYVAVSPGKQIQSTAGSYCSAPVRRRGCLGAPSATVATSGDDGRPWQQHASAETGTGEGSRGDQNDCVGETEREGLPSSGERRPQWKRPVTPREQEVAALPRLRSRTSEILGGFGWAQARGRQMEPGRKGER